MDIQTLQNEFDQFDQDPLLWEPANLHGRRNALIFADFVRQLARARRHQPEIKTLYQKTEALRQRCEQVNQALFAKTRQLLRTAEGRGDCLRRELDRYTSYRPAYA